jgi:hypothetical protein
VRLLLLVMAFGLTMQGLAAEATVSPSGELMFFVSARSNPSKPDGFPFIDVAILNKSGADKVVLLPEVACPTFALYDSRNGRRLPMRPDFPLVNYAPRKIIVPAGGWKVTTMSIDDLLTYYSDFPEYVTLSLCVDARDNPWITDASVDSWVIVGSTILRVDDGVINANKR